MRFTVIQRKNPNEFDSSIEKKLNENDCTTEENPLLVFYRKKFVADSITCMFDIG